MAKDLVNKLANTFRFDELQSAIHVDGGAANGLPQSACHAYRCVICCLLRAPVGSMRGWYHMINLENKTLFKVRIPPFQLSAQFCLN